MQAVETLLERESEVGLLEEALGEACHGSGRLLLIEGPAGAGKTRLLEAAREVGREREMTVLAARASELDREFPLGVVRQLFEPLLKGAGVDRRARLLDGAAALAAPLLGIAPAPSAAGVEGDPQYVRFHALYWLAANLADEAPLMLAIDDAHWADPTSLRFLQFVLPRLEELPVLLALVTRPRASGTEERLLDALATDPLARTLRPRPLSAGAVLELVALALGADADPEFSNACHEATGGNPFLVRELLHELEADSVTPTAAQVPLVQQLAPATVARAVLVRLARLGEAPASLARAVAVLGDGAPLRRACALAGLTEAHAEECAADLARADVFSSTRPLAFEHPVLRSAVYADIDAAARARAHRTAAALLAAEGAPVDAIAVHLLATEPTADPEVVSTLREAAAVALASAAADTAVACLRRALAEPPPASERAHLVLALASAELRAGDAAAAVEHFEEGLRLHPDPRTRAAWVWEQSVALQAVGRNGEAYAVRERAADEVAEHDPELALTVESSLIASASLDLSRLAWARERLDRRRGRLTGATAAEQRLLAMRAYLDALYGTAPAGELADVAERALASGDLVDEASRMVTTAWFAAIEVLWLADRTGPARRALDAAAEDARRRGAGLAFACISGWRCMLLARDGSLLDAEADARSCAEIALSQGGFALAPPMLGYVLSVLIDRGELDDAEQLLERTGMRDRAADDDLALYPMIHARGRVRAGRGDLTGARTDFAALTGRRARWCTEMTLVPALLAAPELGPERFSEADARGMIADAEAWGTARATGLALRAAGLVAGDVDVLERAAAVLERSPARLEHARALTDLGAAMRRSGSRAAAREPLRRALDIADTCGARPLADRTRQELRATGARPRRPRVSGVGALTASERRIVAMAADGLSNPEIAQALFVTKKTVESHLSGAYRKLGIRSRTQLAGALRDD